MKNQNSQDFVSLKQNLHSLTLKVELSTKTAIRKLGPVLPPTMSATGRMWLILLLPGILARTLESPDPNEVPQVFQELYRKCNLSRYLPETAVGAKIWTLEVDPEEKELYAVEYEIDFVDQIKVITRKHLNDYKRAEGIWSYDMSKVGFTNLQHQFYWSDDPTKTLYLGNKSNEDFSLGYHGFAREEYVYAIMKPNGDEHVSFWRWRSDLEPGYTRLSTGTWNMTDYIIFLEPDGLLYKLSGDLCSVFLKFNESKFERFHCNRDSGIYTRRKLDTIYSMTIFAYLTRRCDPTVYEDQWKHAFTKIQFFSGPTTNSTIIVNTTAAMDEAPTSTTKLSPTKVAGLDESAAYIIFGSAVGVFVVVLVIMSIAIWLIYRRRKRKRKMKGQKKPKASKKTKKKTRAVKKKETTETAADTKTETRSTVNTQKSIKNADTRSTTKTQKSFQIPMVSNEDYFSINQGGKTKESKEKKASNGKMGKKTRENIYPVDKTESVAAPITDSSHPFA